MDNIIRALLKHKAERGEEVFCYFYKGEIVHEITYSDLYAGGAAYARHYQENGLNPGDVVLVILDHRPALLYAFIGALLFGCVPSFMPFPSSKQDPHLYWASHRELFARIGAGALVTYPENEPELRQQITDLPLRLFKPEEVRPLTASELAVFKPADPAPETIAFLQHSSGTTGLKKGVALCYQAVSEQISSYAGLLGLEQGDKIATWLPLYHDMGLIACFVMPLTLHIPIVFLDPFEWVSQPWTLFEIIQKHRCTYAWIPNFAYHHLCRTVDPDAGYDLSNIKALIDCSETCKPETFDLFLETFSKNGIGRTQLQVCYAMAETVFAVTQTRPGGLARVLEVDNAELIENQRAADPKPGAQTRRVLSVGAPVPGMEVRIAGNKDEMLPDCAIGEVLARGRFLFSGYFKLPDVSQEALRGGWYHTGDMGFIKDDELYITGRKKDMIIVHGQNFYAHDIEFIVSGIEGVKPGRSVALGVYIEAVGSEEVVVVSETEIEDRKLWPELSKRIKKDILNKLNLSLLEAKIVSPGWLVKTTSGKISRKENLARYLSEKAGK